jgi:hypothetical protein
MPASPASRFTGTAPPAVNYTACASVRNSSEVTVTIAYEMEVLDAGGAAYSTVAPVRPEVSLEPGHINLGCGMTSVYDYDFTHSVASQYRLRVRARTAEGGATAVDGTGALLNEPVAALPPRVVINEFRTRGPNGHDDQFIELFNSSLSPAPMAGSLNAGTNSNLAPSGIFVPPVTIGPLCHYLIASSGFTGGVKPDLTMPAFLTDDGHISYSPGTSSNTTQRDIVGMNGSLSWHYEGTPLPPFPPENIDRSYVRIGVDTNDNLRDFAQHAGTPQNASSCGSR